MSGMPQLVRALEAAGQLREQPAALPEISGVTEDSRRVRPGMLFCAVEGTVQDGHRFVADAAARGAAAVLVARRVEVDVPQLVVADSRTGAAIAAAEWHGRPGTGLRLIGVTGTNGKSTTVALTRHLLNGAGRTGSIGTLGAFDGRGRRIEQYGSLTTPGAVELQAVLAALVERNVATVVMEASSHALDQRRLERLTLAAGVFTNLSHEHLDYHRDFEHYRAAKLRLATLIGDDGAEIVNADDPAWRQMPRRAGVRHIRYGRTADVDVQVLRAELGTDGSSLDLRLGDATVQTRVPLLGEFNVTNAMAAAATAWTLGATADEIAQRLAQTPQVPGRMERLVGDEAPFLILRDYAHTPDALERAIAALRPLTENRLIVLFGAGGDRDRRKRPLMGAIAARGADLAVVTSDNPRTEDPAAIVRDIERGMQAAERLSIVDREEAIHQAIRLLAAGDTLLLAGKGHETYQVIGTEHRPFDEPAIVRAALAVRASA